MLDTSLLRPDPDQLPRAWRNSDQLRGSVERRLQLAAQHAGNPELQRLANAMSAKDVVWWFNTWVWTYDPRNPARGLPPYLPFDLFERQEAFLRWLEDRGREREDGVVPKSRDMGVSWLCVGFALHRWLYWPGHKTTLGANKLDQVDRLGDPDSLFEKMRLLIRRLPVWMLPPGFDHRKHDNQAKLVNPFNGNVIDGEGGDEMGRGGRSSMYFIDEAAFIERAERLDAATSATTDCRIFVSTVNGPGGPFARKANDGVHRCFVLHWRHDPRKDGAWAEREKARLDPVQWAREYEIDFEASQENTVVHGEWVRASMQLRRRINLAPSKHVRSGLDVGGGSAESVLFHKAGPVVYPAEAWADGDTVDLAHNAVESCRRVGSRQLNYDPIGVGKGVQDVLSRVQDLTSVGVNTGEPASRDREWPDERTSRERFVNKRAELWWLTREACRRSWEFMQWLDGNEGGVEHPEDELLALPEDDVLLRQLSAITWKRTASGKVQIESKEDLRKRGIASPDRADALVLTFDDEGDVVVAGEAGGERVTPWAM